VVGNLPFIGNKRLREALGDGYVGALRAAHNVVPDSADLVMYWWDHAARLLKRGEIERFGFITTNSLTQAFNRRVLENHLGQGIALTFAIADHPWVDSSDGAAVRVAMTVARPGEGEGRLLRVTREVPAGNGEVLVTLAEKTGLIHADLSVGANVASALPLRANEKLSNRGVIPHGAGMLVTPEEAAALEADAPLKPYRNGRDLTDKPRGVLVIDCYGLSANEVRQRFPRLYQWLLDRVKPDRDAHRDKDLREKWWLHRRNNEDLRQSLAGLPRYIATGQTAKHRGFQFLDAGILPDDKLIAIALDDAYFLGVLSSRVHGVWALAAGGWMGVGNDPVYNKSKCFDAFPFPDATPEQQQRIRELAEELDAHRKRVLSPRPQAGEGQGVRGMTRRCWNAWWPSTSNAGRKRPPARCAGCARPTSSRRPNPIPTLTLPLKGRETCPSPFKGEAGRGMGSLPPYPPYSPGRKTIRAASAWYPRY